MVEGNGLNEGRNGASMSTTLEGRTGQLLRVDEAANRIGVSPRTMRRLVADRQITYRRVGRIVRITPEDVDTFVEQATVQAA